jgi:methyl-accepting chemotaxis protein
MTITRKITLSMLVVLAGMLAYTSLTMYAMLVVERNIGSDKDRNLNIVRNVDGLQLDVAQQLRGVMLVSSGLTGTPAELQSSRDAALAVIADIKRQVTRKDELAALDAIARDVNSFYNVTVKVSNLAQAGDKQAASALVENEARVLGDGLAARAAGLDLLVNQDIKSVNDRNHREVFLIEVALSSVFMFAIAIALMVAFFMPRVIGRELRGVISRLSTSTAEMLAITTQVASGAVQTATAISEAATTVDEVRQTTLLSSQKATTVSETAQQADAVADSGRRAVIETMEGIQHIQEQMAVVADSVVRLSEQTEAVGEIISTSNDLAEQSNLLSVNAAIEAAKATDRGKGFSVVAEEIKNLAAQSKQAVVQVRSILNDIQRATSQAVMATEQSAKAIEAGARQASESSQAINSLAESVALAAQSAVQIVASSQQELVGMDQISDAMQSIDAASSQNAIGARQIEAEVRHLQELAETLRHMVESGDREAVPAE